MTLRILETDENNDVHTGTNWLIGVLLLIIRLFTHHIRWRMKRKAPGTTRSSLPTLHRRRNTTIPGISSSRSFRRLYLPSNRSRSFTIFSDFQRGPRSNRALSSNHRSTRTWTLLRDLFETRNERQSPRRGRRRVPGRAFP